MATRGSPLWEYKTSAGHKIYMYTEYTKCTECGVHVNVGRHFGRNKEEPIYTVLRDKPEDIHDDDPLHGGQVQ